MSDEAEPERRAPRKPRAPRPGTDGTLINHLSGRVDPLTSAILVFPLFVIYQLGILTSSGLNGVDFVTQGLVELCQRDLTNYLIVLGVMVATYGGILLLLRGQGSFNPRAFLPVLGESLFYALTMGTLILFVMSQFIGVFPGLAVGAQRNPMDVLVISAGAGLHEELVFRVVGVGGLAWLLAGLTGEHKAMIIAILASSLVFSLAHHIGPGGEPFTTAAFVYRTMAGLFFAIIYRLRGFAVAAWTHALYDVYVLSSHMG